MAVLALGAAFSALGGAVGATGVLATVITGVGVAVGSYIDTNFLLPALNPASNIEGTRLNDLRIQYAEEGSPALLPFGRVVRSAGTLIWSSDLIPVETSEEVGGKGGPSTTVTRTEYYLDVACAFAKVGTSPILGVKEIIANGKTVWREAVTITALVTATALAGQQIGSEAIWIVTASTTSLGEFVVGGDVTVSGFATGGNNGTFKVLSATVNSGAGTSELKLQHSGGAAEGPTANVSFSQTPAQFPPALMESAEIYTGALSQTPSPIIEAWEGVGNVPAYRGSAYFVFKRLFVGEFGNTTPQFNVIFYPASGASLPTSITALFSQINVDSSRLDLTDLAGLTCEGFGVSGVTQAIGALQPLTVAYDLLMQASGTKLKLFQRKNATIIDVDPADLATNAAGDDDAPRVLNLTDADDVRIPDSVVVKYIDKDNKYQTGAQRAKARVGGQLDSELVVNLPLALTNGGGEAVATAKRLLYSAMVRRTPVRFSLPPKYAFAQENDVLRIPATQGRTWYLLVNRIDRGDNFLLQFETVPELLATVDQSQEFDARMADPTPPTTATNELVFEPNGGGGGGHIPEDGLIPPPYIVVPACAIDPSLNYSGASVYRRRKDEEDADYKLLGNLLYEAVMGRVTSVLGGGVSGLKKDGLNSVTVELFEGALSSRSQADILRGNNLLKIGNEWLAAETATLVAERTYTLSGLYRGRQDTAAAIGTHTLNETCILLSSIGVANAAFPVPVSMLNVPHYIKVVPAGRSLASVSAYEFTPQDLGLRPRPVADFRQVRDHGTKDVFFRWQHVSKRGTARLFGANAAPLTFPTEKYQVDVFFPSGSGTKIATKTVTGDNRLNYTASEQATDGISPAGSAFDVQVHQINDNFGGDGRGVGSGVTVVAAS